jgi:hypothetical protein
MTIIYLFLLRLLIIPPPKALLVACQEATSLLCDNNRLTACSLWWHLASKNCIVWLQYNYLRIRATFGAVSIYCLCLLHSFRRV